MLASARILLLIGLSVAYGASILATGPMMPDLGCDMFDIVQPNPNLMPSTANTYYYVYGTNTEYGFSSGEIYTNSIGTFMNVADNQGPLYWNIPSGTQSQWSPSVGTLYVFINLYSDAARTQQIGSGNFTSTDFFAHNLTDPLSPHGWVIAVGGNVTLSYTLTAGSKGPDTADGFSTTAFQSRTEILVFPPNKNMWDQETFTNRYFTRADAATFSAPLFDTDGSQTFWSSGAHLTPYTANYDAVIQLWGSNGFDPTKQQYTNPNLAADVAWGLTCSGGPPSIHILPPPCPSVPDCTGCTTQATVSGLCSQQATATTQADCLTFTVDDTLSCTSATSSVQV